MASSALSLALPPKAAGTLIGAFRAITARIGVGELAPRDFIALLIATYLALPAPLAASDLIATVPRRVAEQIAAKAGLAAAAPFLL